MTKSGLKSKGKWQFNSTFAFSICIERVLVWNRTRFKKSQVTQLQVVSLAAMFLYICHWNADNNIEVNWKCAGSSLFARPKVWKRARGAAAIARMFSSKTFGFTKQPQLARCWLGDLIKPIYLYPWLVTHAGKRSLCMNALLREKPLPAPVLALHQSETTSASQPITAAFPSLLTWRRMCRRGAV